LRAPEVDGKSPRGAAKAKGRKIHLLAAIDGEFSDRVASSKRLARRQA
jgi:hypothetical protein